MTLIIYVYKNVAGMRSQGYLATQQFCNDCARVCCSSTVHIIAIKLRNTRRTHGAFAHVHARSTYDEHNLDNEFLDAYVRPPGVKGRLLVASFSAARESHSGWHAHEPLARMPVRSTYACSMVLGSGTLGFDRPGSRVDEKYNELWQPVLASSPCTFGGHSLLMVS